MTAPVTKEASIRFMGVFQIVISGTRATRKAIGIAFVAGHLKPAISIKIAAIGTVAIRASSPALIMESFIEHLNYQIK